MSEHPETQVLKKEVGPSEAKKGSGVPWLGIILAASLIGNLVLGVVLDEASGQEDAWRDQALRMESDRDRLERNLDALRERYFTLQDDVRRLVSGEVDHLPLTTKERWTSYDACMAHPVGLAFLPEQLGFERRGPGSLERDGSISWVMRLDNAEPVGNLNGAWFSFGRECRVPPGASVTIAVDIEGAYVLRVTSDDGRSRSCPKEGYKLVSDDNAALSLAIGELCRAKALALDVPPAGP